MANAADETIDTLMRQAIRWSVAAEQDKNPLIRILHANYGMAYITALRQVSSNGDVKRVTGYDPREIERKIGQIQDWALRTFVPHVPQMIPKGPLGKLIGR